MKIFVTGVYGSGKTFLAKKISKEENLPYISYDDVYDYQLHEDQYNRIMGSLPENYVIDAIVGTNWKAFIEDQVNKHFSVICCYCSNKDVWIERVKEKPAPVIGPERETLMVRAKRVTSIKILCEAIFKRVLKVLRWGKNKLLQVNPRIQTWWIKNFTEEGRTPAYFPPYFTNEHFSLYRKFYLEKIPLFEKMSNIKYYDTIASEYTSLSEMKSRLNLPLLEIEEKIYQHGYDTFYQDIESLEIIGYSRSLLTWKRLKRIINWQGKTVLDIGCFHGYFCFKIEELGAKRVVGLEKSSTVLDVTRKLAQLINSHAEFREWVGGDDYPECDVVLFLNVIHHFGDLDMQRNALKKVRPETQAIFEINKEQIPLIEELFTIVKSLSSHRKNRRIFLATRNSIVD